jgi:hypothetical protein
MRDPRRVRDQSAQGDPASQLPRMHRVDPRDVVRNLDHADMVALSGMFRRWAIRERSTTPEQNTRLIEWSADFERLAEWVGPKWCASDPSDEPDILKFMATLERRHSNVVSFDDVRAILGRQ